MIPDLLWIVGFYAAAAALAHGVLARRPAGPRLHYVLVAGNHQMQIEWYVRSLLRFSRRTGTDIGITVVLDQAEDDTGPIVARFARCGDGVGWVRVGAPDGPASREALAGLEPAPDADAHAAHGGNPRIVWVDLHKQEDVSRLPL